MQEAGADALLELAFTLADGLEYVRTGNLNIMYKASNILIVYHLSKLCIIFYLKVSMPVLMWTLLHLGYLSFGVLE